MVKNGWSKLFEDPVVLPDGRELLTLKRAADYIMKLPKAEQEHERWQAAIQALLMAAEDRDVERVFSDRKDHHWGKRKPARDR